jgi:hypothetical protein
MLLDHPWDLRSGREDLNLRPHGPEPCALAGLRYAPSKCGPHGRTILYSSLDELTSIAPTVTRAVARREAAGVGARPAVGAEAAGVGARSCGAYYLGMTDYSVTYTPKRMGWIPV